MWLWKINYSHILLSSSKINLNEKSFSILFCFVQLNWIVHQSGWSGTKAIAHWLSELKKKWENDSYSDELDFLHSPDFNNLCANLNLCQLLLHSQLLVDPQIVCRIDEVILFEQLHNNAQRSYLSISHEAGSYSNYMSEPVPWK